LNSVLRRRLLVAVILVLFILFAFFAPYEQTITGQCFVEHSWSWSLKHISGGVIAAEWDRSPHSQYENFYFRMDEPDISDVELSDKIREGYYISKDDTVAVIESKNSEALLDHYRIELERERRRLDLMLSGARPEDIEVAKRNLERAKVRYELYEGEYQRVTTLYESGLTSVTIYDQTKSEYRTRETEYKLAESQLKAAESGYHPVEIKIQREEILKFEQLVAFQENLLGNSYVLKSPLSGLVGTKIYPENLVTIQGIDTIAIKVVFAEAFASDLIPGEDVEIQLPGLNYSSLQVQIDNVGFFGGDTLAVFGVGRYENPDHLLRPGMHGSAKLHVGKSTLFQRIKNLVFN